MLGHILHLDGVAQVRLVGTVLGDRLVVGNARPLLGDGLLLPVGVHTRELLEDAGDDRLHRREDVVLLDEAHLDVELIELARQAVGARVLVAEAGRDLEVAVEARHHQKLLVLLRRLRQGVELAGVNARGDEKVARAFGRGRRQNRRRELEEAGLRHALPDRGGDGQALHDVLVQRLAPADRGSGTAGADLPDSPARRTPARAAPWPPTAPRSRWRTAPPRRSAARR